jgi:hypothetical protein
VRGARAPQCAKAWGGPALQQDTLDSGARQTARDRKSFGGKTKATTMRHAMREITREAKPSAGSIVLVCWNQATTPVVAGAALIFPVSHRAASYLACNTHARHRRLEIGPSGTYRKQGTAGRHAHLERRKSTRHACERGRKRERQPASRGRGLPSALSNNV